MNPKQYYSLEGLPLMMNMTDVAAVLVRLGMAQADGQAALRVPVDQQHFLSGLCQPDPQVRAGGCLANAAFLVSDGDDLRVQ